MSARQLDEARPAPGQLRQYATKALTLGPEPLHVRDDIVLLRERDRLSNVNMGALVPVPGAHRHRQGRGSDPGERQRRGAKQHVAAWRARAKRAAKLSCDYLVARSRVSRKSVERGREWAPLRSAAVRCRGCITCTRTTRLLACTDEVTRRL